MNRIALVEDNPDNRLLVRALLKDRYELTEYASGKVALDGLVRQRPHLVLLDISLPEVDGMEILRQMRADVRLEGIPVIALTAHAMAGDRERLLAVGFDAYLTKPILDPRVLIGEIEKLLGD